MKNKKRYEKTIGIICCLWLLILICLLSKRQNNILYSCNNNKQVSVKKEIPKEVSINKSSSVSFNTNNRIQKTVSVNDVLGKVNAGEAKAEHKVKYTLVVISDNEVPLCDDVIIEDNISHNRWGLVLSEEDTLLLEQIVYKEAGNQCDKGQQAVAEVIMNRIYSDIFPDTLTGVLSQSGQFVTWKQHYGVEPSEQVIDNVEKVLNGDTNILPYKTMYFSRGATNNDIQIVIEDHVFCNQSNYEELEEAYRKVYDD